VNEEDPERDRETAKALGVLSQFLKKKVLWGVLGP